MSIVSINILKNFLKDEIAKASEDISNNNAYLDEIDAMRERRTLAERYDIKEQQINLDNSTLSGRRQAMQDVLMHVVLQERTVEPEEEWDSYDDRYEIDEMEAKIAAADLERDTI
jgi:hypothetical protein